MNVVLFHTVFLTSSLNLELSCFTTASLYLQCYFVRATAPILKTDIMYNISSSWMDVLLTWDSLTAAPGEKSNWGTCPLHSSLSSRRSEKSEMYTFIFFYFTNTDKVHHGLKIAKFENIFVLYVNLQISQYSPFHKYIGTLNVWSYLRKTWGSGHAKLSLVWMNWWRYLCTVPVMDCHSITGGLWPHAQYSPLSITLNRINGLLMMHEWQNEQTSWNSYQH